MRYAQLVKVQCVGGLKCSAWATVALYSIQSSSGAFDLRHRYDTIFIIVPTSQGIITRTSHYDVYYSQ